MRVRPLQMGGVGKMSEDVHGSSGWHHSITQQLQDAEGIMNFEIFGAEDRPHTPDYIRVTLAPGNDSKFLDDILGHENNVILSASIGEGGELILDITNPKLLDRFFLSGLS